MKGLNSNKTIDKIFLPSVLLLSVLHHSSMTQAVPASILAIDQPGLAPELNYPTVFVLISLRGMQLPFVIPLLFGQSSESGKVSNRTEQVYLSNILLL